MKHPVIEPREANTVPQTHAREQNAAPGLRGGLRRNLSVLLALLAGAGIIYGHSWWAGRSMPVRLGDLPDLWLTAGFHGDGVVGQARQGGFVLVPIRGGRSRTLLSADANASLSAWPAAQPAVPTERRTVIDPSSVVLTDDGLLYTTFSLPRVFSPGPSAFRSAGRSLSIVRRVVYRKVSPAEMGFAKPVRIEGRYNLFHLSLDAGATPVELATDLNEARVTVAGNKIYWVEHREWSPLPASLKPSLAGGVQTIPLLPPCNRLVRASRSGGPPAVMETALYGSWLTGGVNGVFWLESTPTTGQPETTLYFLPNDRTAAYSLPNYRGVGTPVDCGGRIYWLQHADGRQHNQVNGLQGALRLMSAPADLSSTTEEAALDVTGELLRPGNEGGFRSLFARHGELYLLCAGPIKIAGESEPDESQRQGGDGGSPTGLYRVALRPRAALQKVTTFPRDSRAFYVSRDCVYATVDELRESWFDWSPKGLMGKSVKVVYRYRFP